MGDSFEFSSGLQPSTFKLRPSTFNLQASAFKLRPSSFDLHLPVDRNQVETRYRRTPLRLTFSLEGVDRQVRVANATLALCPAKSTPIGS